MVKGEHGLVEQIKFKLLRIIFLLQLANPLFSYKEISQLGIFTT